MLNVLGQINLHIYNKSVKKKYFNEVKNNLQSNSIKFFKPQLVTFCMFYLVN